MWFVQNHCRDLRPGYDHLLRYLEAAQAIIASEPASFRRCYGSEFTDRFGNARWGTRTTGTGRHAFDRVCASRNITHKLTRPYRPQTNGMVERFNRRLAEAIRARSAARRNNGKNKFDSHTERNAFIHSFVDTYNRTRLRCLNYSAPLEALINHTEHNT